jgi:GNAT superfamily N-acetyltransferase
LITHFLGDQEVAAYARDFAQRLVALNTQFPKKWFVLGQSGEKMGNEIFQHLPPAFQDKVQAGAVYVDRRTNRVRFSNSIKGVSFRNAPVLLIDGAVHTGESMSRAMWHLWQAGAKNVLTYTLMLKRSSKMVPTYFGVLVDDKDRVYFQLNIIPNNRLCETPPFGVLKEVSQTDIHKSIRKMAAPFENLSIGDMLYDKDTKDYHPYIYEYKGDIAGFVIFGKESQTLFIDAWGTVPKYQNRGIGGAMLRWAETWGRSNRCDAVKLWAYQRAIRTYQYLGYEFIGDERLTLKSNERFRLMGKKLLYNSKLTGHWP